jgi:hypothetical protein
MALPDANDQITTEESESPLQRSIIQGCGTKTSRTEFVGKVHEMPQSGKENKLTECGRAPRTDRGLVEFTE